MDPDFSEFSYGYCITDDLINGRGMAVRAAPVFPSLVQEGRYGGYDVRLDRPGIPLFLQFKLAYCMTRRSAKEARAGLFGIPFYRMYLRPGRHSTQHQSLLALEQSGQAVFYFAPGFHERLQLDDAYRRAQVWDRSLKIRPVEIGPVDGGPHHIAFQYPGGWVLRSEEDGKKQEAATTEQIERALTNRLADVQRTTAEAEIVRVDAVVRQLIVRRAPHVPAWAEADLAAFEREFSPTQRLAYFARRFFDCQLFLVQGR